MLFGRHTCCEVRICTVFWVFIQCVQWRELGGRRPPPKIPNFFSLVSLIQCSIYVLAYQALVHFSTWTGADTGFLAWRRKKNFPYAQKKFAPPRNLWIGATECVADVVRHDRLRWFRHLGFRHLNRESWDDWVPICRNVDVAGVKCRGRNKTIYRECMTDDMKLLGLQPEWVIFRDMWRDFKLGQHLTLAVRGRNRRFHNKWWLWWLRSEFIVVAQTDPSTSQAQSLLIFSGDWARLVLRSVWATTMNSGLKLHDFAHHLHFKWAVIN